MFIAHVQCPNCKSILRPDRDYCPICKNPITEYAKQRNESLHVEMDLHYGEKSTEKTEDKPSRKKAKKAHTKIKRVYRKRKG